MPSTYGLFIARPVPLKPLWLGLSVSGYFTNSASTISATQIVPAITYSHVHDSPAVSSRARMAGPMMAPTPKKPSAVFMIDVCWAVEVEMSPMSASAPVLNTPMARPDRPSITAKNRNELPEASRKQAAANSIRPTTMVRRRPRRSASWPRKRPAMAMPAIVAY